MPDWQERITRETPPAVRAEHELRYAAAAPLVHASAAWCDLGCGTGLGAAAGLGASYAGRALLVDADAGAAAEARANLGAHDTIALTADLSAPEDLQRIRAALLEAAPDGSRCITCFEVIEHLESFVPVVELLVELAEHERCAIVMSVPNDAFWTIENPHHTAMWGAGSVEELRRLLPADHVLVHQVALQGSALVRDEQAAEATAHVASGPGVPSHFILAFGPGAEALATPPRVVQTDVEEQRRWERQRESDLRYLAATHEGLRKEVARVAELLDHVKELEHRLRRRSPRHWSGAALRRLRRAR